MKTLLWLDDVRDPLKDDWLVFSPISQPFKTVWVKSYQEFVDWIKKSGLPDAICFDHDLADTHYQPAKHWDPKHPDHEPMDYNLWEKGQAFKEKTGMDCAKWLVEYCLDNSIALPPYNIQSANPAGKANIDGLLKSFKQSV